MISVGRTRYVRTDSTTAFAGYVNQSWSVYDPVNNRFFSADPGTNRVIVMDAKSQSEVATIPVPGAFGLDETPDHKTLYVGTQIGDLYAVDPASMTVTRRYLASEIGPEGYHAFTARVLADGRLALLGGQGGIPNVDGYGSVAVWNPADNSLVVYKSYYQSGFGSPPSVVVCGQLLNIGSFALTGDRAKIVIASIDSDGTVCTIDPATGKDDYITGAGSALHLAASNDGKYIVEIGQVDNHGEAFVYDAATLNPVRQFPLAFGPDSSTTLTISADSATLFLASQSILYAYDLSSGQQTGWLPDFYLPGYSGLTTGSLGPNLGPEDSTGLLFGPLEEGVGFLDTAALRAGPVGTQFVNAYLTPGAGPISGGTQIQWSGAANVALAGVFIGGNQATSASISAGGQISAVTPGGSPGPADVYSIVADGGAQLLPEAFSYGPTILEAAPGASTTEGGGTGFLFGYGFGSLSSSTIPTGLQVMVGGQAATVTGFDGNAYGTASPPFPLEAISYTIPAGTEGSGDVALQNSAGTAVLKGGIQYLPKTQQFALAGAALVQGVYDSYHDVYYFTDATKIQVFSRTQGAWLTPISIPAPTGAKSQRLWGLALSADGSKLAIADAAADVIYLLNPAHPTSVQTFPLPPSPAGTISSPIGLAITNSGIVYYVAPVSGGSGYHYYFKLDTTSGTVTDLGIPGPGTPGNDVYLRIAMSADDARVYFNNNGEVFSIDTATNAFFFASTDPACCYGDDDLSLSSNQTSFEASSYLYDSDLNARSYLALNLRETLGVLYVYGAKLSPDGSLLFQPTVTGMDVYDGRLGTLRTRVALPFALSPNYDALVSDGKDNTLVAITGTGGDGVAVIDLTSLMEPGALPYLTHTLDSRSPEPFSHETRRTPGLRAERPDYWRPTPARMPHYLTKFMGSVPSGPALRSTR